ncbi:SDR family NAD(P)-dependent oxidoreductase [Rhizobium alvei]|uniref:Glucose 1-dehydrogenase n=1 Tax=Rhizobium alvei TaxID=1132659 RepID=A0ABT8YJ70_9HYPH|nr:glucose 1-dehydrogenase [Rhizobium alvei]MDO6963383.1 glucose 1-dehydrogenase [Rhizobium alvei]
MTRENDEARFAGKVVLITGAVGGLGRKIASDFAEEGASLLMSDRDGGALEALAGELQSMGAAVAISVGDVTREATAEAMVATALATFGRLDIAVNNAGIASSFTRLADTGPEEAERILAVNVLGVIHAMRHELRVMSEAFSHTGQHSAIVNMASVAGLVGAPNLAVYAASKHAVIGLTRSSALEYARRGIRINAVCPSFVRTPMLAAITAGQAHPDTEGLAQGVPMRRLAEPDEISIAVRFAADPRNSFMTGQALGIDGGLTAM